MGVNFKAKSSVRSEGFPIKELRQALERIMEGEEHGRGKKAFHSYPYGFTPLPLRRRSRTKTPKGRMFKKV